MADSAVAIRSVVGDDRVRDGGAGDAIDGVPPRYVASPRTVEETSALLSLARTEGWRVAPRGGGTSLRLGNVPRGLDLVLDLTAMDRVLEHAAGDLVAAVEAGARMDALQAKLAGAGQMLALDGYAPGATAGGVIAANTSGPRRLRYGTVRDLLIGITVVLPDGTIAKAGGKVVKNVAGYDLSKLMTGSLGTLGVIVKAIFRLHPRPAARRLVVAEVGGAEGVGEVVQRVLHSTLVPTALQLAWSDAGAARIGLLLEGVEPSVVAQAELATTLLGGESAPRVLGEEDADASWRELTTPPSGERELVVKVTCLPTALGDTVAGLRDAAREHGGGYHLGGAIGNGIVQLHLDASDAERAGALVGTMRGAVRSGHVTVVSAAPEVKRGLDVWGPVGDAEALMRRVKHRFDPGYILNSGRFVGGI